VTHLSRWSLCLLLLLSGGSLAAGCYTVLRHPEPDDLVAQETGTRKACEDCHVDSRFYHDAFDPWFYGFGGYWAYQDWSDYYYRPWWYQDYWYYGPDPHDQAGVPVETRGQHMWGGSGRRTFLPGFPPVTQGSGAGTGTPGGSAPGTQGSKPAPTDKGDSGHTSREESRQGNRRETGRRDMGTQKAPETQPPAEPDSNKNDEDDDDGGRNS
jgi:hypothetical protein